MRIPGKVTVFKAKSAQIKMCSQLCTLTEYSNCALKGPVLRERTNPGKCNLSALIKQALALQFSPCTAIGSVSTAVMSNSIEGFEFIVRNRNSTETALTGRKASFKEKGQIFQDPPARWVRCVLSAVLGVQSTVLFETVPSRRSRCSA